MSFFQREVFSVLSLPFMTRWDFYNPLIVKFKLLFQIICLNNFSWDEEINEDLKGKWYDLVN